MDPSICHLKSQELRLLAAVGLPGNYGVTAIAERANLPFKRSLRESTSVSRGPRFLPKYNLQGLLDVRRQGTFLAGNHSPTASPVYIHMYRPHLTAHVLALLDASRGPQTGCHC